MAILIPSKNIYEKQNPKVRDNVIDIVEVDAKQVSIVRQEKENVYDATILFDANTVIAIEDKGGNFKIEKNTLTEPYTCLLSYVGIYDCKKVKIKVEIPRVRNNKYIKNIEYYKKENADEPEIELSVQGEKLTGDIKATYSYTGNIPYQDTLITTNIEYINETYKTPQQYSIPTIVEHAYKNGSDSITSSINFGDNGNIAETTPTITKDKITFDFEIYVGFTTIKYGDFFLYPQVGGNERTVGGIYEKYVPKEIKLSFYGDTIGIDLTDKTVYINGQTAKKVHSVDGNELMQTDNYLLDSGKSAIEKMYGDTQLEYALGKETATIRCSIADYYEADKDGNKTDEKVISTDNSTGKMCFDIGDIVVPMVYGADGVDRPMSKANGHFKSFKVLGTKIYYDGAVWQEISLQEV